jgi:hypothetical protein
MQTIRYIALVFFANLCLSYVLPVSAQPTVTLNGLFADKAVLLVDGEPLILTVGETKNRIKLLQVDDTSATVLMNGESQTLALVRITLRALPGVAALKVHDDAKSHILKAQLIHQTPNIATFEVEYYVNADEGDHFSLSARTMFKDEITRYWVHSFSRLKPGRHTTTINISMREDAPESYMSDVARFDIMLTKGRDTQMSGTKIIEFIKEWRK